MSEELIPEEDKIAFIKKSLNNLEKYCQDNGFKCCLSFGGGTQYTGGIMEYDENAKMLVQKTESHLVRTFSNLMFRVTIKDTDYDGKHINVIGDMAENLFNSLPNSDDFDAQETGE